MPKKKEKVEPELVACEGKIYFKPIEARDLKGGKKLAPFCKVFLDKEKRFQTEVMDKTHDPAWDEIPRLVVLSEEVPVEKVRFVIYHKGSLMTDYIGELSFMLSDLLDGVPRDDWFVLKNKKGNKDMGELHLQIMYLDKGEDMTKEKEEFPYPLQTLLRKKNYKAWSTLLDQDPDIDKPDGKGRTALHVAAELGLKEHLSILLQRNADVTSKDNNEQTALHLAAATGNVDCTALLLEAGAAVNSKDSTGCSPLHVACAKNHSAVATILLDKGASVSAQDENGDTSLHHALRELSVDCIPLLVERGADIYLENAKSQSSCALSVVVGEDSESVQNCFFKAINIVDQREFELKRAHKHRHIIEHTGLAEDWHDNPQIIVSGPASAEIFLLMHYDDPISKTTLPMEKCAFVAFRNSQQQFKELTYWHDNLQYAKVAPLSIIIQEQGASYCLIPYSKLSKATGKWHIVAYSDSEFNIETLKAWPNSKSFAGKWEGENAGGCIEHQATFVKNPRYRLKLPSKVVTLGICISQEKNLGDVEPFAIIPYKYYIGYYLIDKDPLSPIQRILKWKNAREGM